MSNDTKYFDINVNGVAYLNRPRVVKPKEGNNNAYKSVNFNMLTGPANKVRYVQFSTTIVGKQAKEVLTSHWDRLVAADAEGKKILAQVRITDPQPDTYSTKQGEVRNIIRGRLLSLSFIRIDGEEIYKAPPRETNGASSQTSSSEEGGSEDTRPQTSSDKEDESGDTRPQTVKLTKEDPNFEQRKAELKAQGYRWNSDQGLWALPPAK